MTVRIFPDATHSLMDAHAHGFMAAGVFDTLGGWLGARALAPDGRRAG